MGTIDTIRFQDQSITIGTMNFEAMDRVPFRVWAKVVVAMVLAKLEKRRTRKHLSELDADQLRDIGLTLDQADNEVRRSLPFYWRER